MYYLSEFAFQEISSGALEKLEKNPSIWNNNINKRKIKRENEIIYDKLNGKRIGVPKVVNTNNYFSNLDNKLANKALMNRAKTIGILGGVGGLGYLGYKGYERFKKKNPKGLEIGDETDRKVISTIGKGTKWAVGATASGKALDYVRRFIGYHYANNKLKKPFNITPEQKAAYENIVKNRGAWGELKNNYNAISGVGNVGNKVRKVLSTKWGKGLAVGGLGAVGAGLYGYNKAKEYYLI